MQGKEEMSGLWVPDERRYQSGFCEIEVDGEKYEYHVSEIKLPDLEDYPSEYRIITECSPDLGLEAKHDGTFVILPGWGETTAQFEGDFLNVLLKALKDAGFSCPHIIGVNACGKGTKEYMENSDRVSANDYEDERFDIENLADYLWKNDMLGDNVWLIGHSMGGLNTIALLEYLKTMEMVGACLGSNWVKVNGVMQMMPAWNERLSLVKPKFLAAVRKQVPSGVKQWATGKGSLDLSFEDHDRIMFESKGDEANEAHWMRGVPDSARKFFGITLNWRRHNKNVYMPDVLNGVQMHFLRGGKDRLIPSSTVGAAYNCANDNWWGERRVTLTTASDLPHSFPMQMREAQREQLHGFIYNALRRGER